MTIKKGKAKAKKTQGRREQKEKVKNISPQTIIISP
jgi:hypothetical protein